MKGFVSWSGGKETSLACYRVVQNQDINPAPFTSKHSLVAERGGVKVAYLLNMISEDGRRSRSHGVSAALLKAQSDAMGIPIVQRKTTWGSYERIFKETVLELKREGIEIGIFGDIDLQEHRDWVERVCREIEIKPLLPLWEEDREKLLKEFIRTGFKAIVVATKADLLGREWLGRRIDEEFIKDLKRLNDVDLCGEKGEYHTFVFDGPLFKKRIEITKSKKVSKENHWFLEILKWGLKK